MAFFIMGIFKGNFIPEESKGSMCADTKIANIPKSFRFIVQYG